MSTLKDKILAELDVDRAMSHILWLTENTPRRISGTGQDRIAAEYIVKEMKSYGCEAEILEFETYNSRPGTSEITILSPELKTLDSMPCCHIEPTSPDELIYVGAGGEDDYDDKDVEGKAVLVEVSYAPATPEKAMIAYRKGAKAMICMNWGRKDEAVYYMKKLMIFSEVFLIACCAVVYVLARPITMIGGMEAKSAEMCLDMMFWITIVKPIVWMFAFIPAYGMRAAGDVKFSMITSCITMWTFRFCLCVYLIRVCGMGPMAVWNGMFTDWTVRAIVFGLRFKSGKWMEHKVV